MTVTGRLFRNIASSWFILLVNIVVSFFLAPFVVHSLGNVYYGIWAIIGQFTGYLYLLDFGVRESVIRYTSKYLPRRQTTKLNRVLSTALLLYAPIVVLCILLSLAAAWAFPYWFNIEPEHIDTARAVVLLVGLTIAQTFIFNVFTGILQGLHRFDVTNLFGVVVTLLRTAAIVAALKLGYGIVAMSVIQLVFAILSGLYTAYMAVRMLRQSGMAFRPAWLSWRQFRAMARNVGGYSLFVLLNNIGQKIVLVSDAIIIGIFMPVAAVTYYAIAGSLVGYLRTLVTATAQVFNPLTSHYASLRDSRQVQQVLIRGCKLTILISLPVIAAYAILGREFIGLWMGTEYAQVSGDILLILALLFIFSSPHHVISSVLYGLSRHGALSALRLGEAAANLVLSIVLVQKYGLMGVAWGSALPHLVMTAVILPVMVTRVVGLTPAQYFTGVYLGPALAIVPFVSGAFLFQLYLPAQNLLIFFLQIGLLVVLYLAVGYRLALDPSERSAVQNHLRQIRNRLVCQQS